MSLKVVGMMAITGISAVAAYVLLVRKKEKEEIDNKDITKTQVRVSEKETNPTTNSPVKEVGMVSVEDDFTQKTVQDKADKEKCGIFSEETIDAKTDAKVPINVEISYQDSSSKTESLMEWIDRQLAESKSRNSTPGPEAYIKQDSHSEEIATENEKDISNAGNNIVHPETHLTLEKVEVFKNSIDFVEKIENVEVGNVGQNEGTCGKDELVITEGKIETNTEVQENFAEDSSEKEEKENYDNGYLASETKSTDSIAPPKEKETALEILNDPLDSKKDEKYNDIEPHIRTIDNEVTDELCDEMKFVVANIDADISQDDIRKPLDSAPENETKPNYSTNNPSTKEEEETKGSLVSSEAMDVVTSNTCIEENTYANAGLMREAETDNAHNTELAKIENITSKESVTDKRSDSIRIIDDDSDVEIQLLKGFSDNKASILEDSDSSWNYSDSDSYEEKKDTMDRQDKVKSEDLDFEMNGNKHDLNDSIGLKLRPSWQIKDTQQVHSEVDAKLTSI